MCFFDASQIEFLLHALQVRLRFDLVIIFEPCSCSAGCSNEHWIGIVVIPTLLNRPNVFGLFRHPKKLFHDDNEIKQDTECWVVSEQQAIIILFDWHKRAFW